MTRPLASCPFCAAEVQPREYVRAQIGGEIVGLGECCGLTLQSPRVTPAESAAYMNARWSSSDAYVADHAAKLEEATRRCRWLVERFGVSGPVLDVGAGSGAFVRAARDCGLDATGIEVSRAAVERARAAYGVDLLGGFPDPPREPPFAAITLWDVIEHVREPAALLRECRRRLRPGGVLIVETGNYESAARLREGAAWPLYLFDHLFYFSPSTLERLLVAAGFTAFRLESIPSPQPRRSRGRRLLSRAARAIRNPRRAYRHAAAAREARRRWPNHCASDLIVASATVAG